MLKLKLFLLFIVCSLFAQIDTNDTSLSYRYKVYEYYFKNGVRDYKIGSYYDAIDEFNHLVKRPENPFYKDALKYLAKTYIQVGKRTGEKRYLWSALNMLNSYLVVTKHEDADYLATKGFIYELLGFYERALTYYKMALRKAQTKEQRLQITLGILRSVVWLKKLDLATKYIVLLNIEQLSKKQSKEFIFLKGMYYFMKGDYAKAITFFRKTYREFESYLIENPNYYYIVAETAYRIGDFTFAQRLFRRILNYIKNREVIQKSLLRLGDIKFLQNEQRASANYYYRLIRNFANTTYSDIAKLKILYMMQEDKKMAYFIKKFLPDAPFLQNPQKFVIEILVKKRGTYEGLFALANFGLFVFELEKKELFDRLVWELSLLNVSKLKYEHKEYFRRLWSRYLIRYKNVEHICELYRSNPDFFFKVFDKKVLIELGKRMKKCKKRETMMDFYKKFAQYYPEKNVLFETVKALFESKRYDESWRYLQKIKEKSCKYYLWASKICFMLDRKCDDVYKQFVENCKENPLYRLIFYYVLKNNITFKDVEPLVGHIARLYLQDPVIKKFLRSLVFRLLQDSRYEDLITLLSDLVPKLNGECELKSILALSYIRVDKIGMGKELLSRMKDCRSIWYRLAQNILADKELQKRVENVGENR